ncbi:hypothetical protein COS74_02785 [bacterium CG06_land_8_20_14_3_00_33_50]|nr:MAG: hypothetical protein COU50_03325 [bacterium CG10_big_fil_rev_8_21_14_0_10_33_18]PIU76658.1 MAG: hypothetical protein COS74_02785 [bacterium CG06_land_8_20_14_3_00_33_50]PIW81476.1 MAG: hypothetical protein COZ97_01685 [bacterium CG_4_8_14_3_um_filter_33_28]PIY85455.1 MAG: hypothetical protein COY76_02075 [bacterium CG_4_10_14_0_8_um_filter_33_57]PJA71782.1 MAG: hypothetical protein CO152_04885 [bacterium CG_4_9_14_3_um_filter_33_26]
MKGKNKMATVDILIKGYNKEINDNFHRYASTTTLVRSNDINIVVDPGIHESLDLYNESLKQYGLSTDDIDYVFCTHEHLDHTRDIAVFKNAAVIDRWGTHKGDEHHFDELEEKEIIPQVKRVLTLGHGLNHVSLLVETNKGVVCVAGDLWWYEDLTPAEDDYATDQKELEKSREKILKIADFIIPGHGGLVKNIMKG